MKRFNGTREVLKKTFTITVSYADKAPGIENIRLAIPTGQSLHYDGHINIVQNTEFSLENKITFELAILYDRNCRVPYSSHIKLYSESLELLDSWSMRVTEIKTEVIPDVIQYYQEKAETKNNK